MTQEFEEAKLPISVCAERCLKGDVKSNKGQQTIQFQSTTRTKTIIIRMVLTCNQFCKIRRSVCLV